MSSEWSIAHEAEDRMGHWLRGHEGASKIQLVVKDIENKKK